MELKIQYFAQLREERGCAEETIQTTATDASALYQELSARHGFSLTQDSLSVAVNDDFVEWNTEFSAGDKVVFIPPVAGG